MRFLTCQLTLPWGLLTVYSDFFFFLAFSRRTKSLVSDGLQPNCVRKHASPRNQTLKTYFPAVATSPVFCLAPPAWAQPVARSGRACRRGGSAGPHLQTRVAFLPHAGASPGNRL